MFIGRTTYSAIMVVPPKSATYFCLFLYFLQPSTQSGHTLTLTEVSVSLLVSDRMVVRSAC
jgi:hypothetical protein